MKMYDGLNEMLTGEYLLHKMSVYPEYNHLYIISFFYFFSSRLIYSSFPQLPISSRLPSGSAT